MTYAKTKDQTIETLRGIAILLVVAGYIIQYDLDRGTHSVFLTFLKFSYNCLKPVRMPLFTVISSYLYAAFPATHDTYTKLIVGKTRRILIPFVFVSAIQYTIFSLFHVQGTGPMSGILGIYIQPFHQFWFLFAIFWIFVVVGFLDSLKAFDTIEKWLGWLALSSACSIAFDPTHLLAINGINYLFPFFLMGYGFRRYSKELFSPRMIILYAGMMIIAYGLYFYFRTLPSNDSLYKAVSLFCSFSIVPLLFHFRLNIPWLSKIGYFAFGIHIFNRISSAIPEMLFERFHINNEILGFLLYFCFGILFSIGIQIVFERYAVTKKYILGMK